MNIIQLITDVITTFLYEEGATLEPYEQQVIYLIAFITAIYMLFVFVRFLTRIFRY